MPPGVGGLNCFFARKVGNSPIKKNCQGVLPGGDGQAWNLLIQKMSGNNNNVHFSGVRFI